jgi:tetratricopeptide (TPR) repeat protein
MSGPDQLLFAEKAFAAKDYAQAWGNRGHLRRERGELDLALGDLERALKHDPDYVFAHLRRAQCLQALGRLEEAEQDLAQILLKNPCDAFPFRLWREVRSQRGLSSDAASLPAPKDASAFIARGMAFAQNNEQLRAIADYDAAIALRPAPYAFLNRGLAHRALGNLAQAKADLEVWVKVDPAWAPAVAAIDAALQAQSGP